MDQELQEIYMKAAKYEIIKNVLLAGKIPSYDLANVLEAIIGEEKEEHAE